MILLCILRIVEITLKNYFSIIEEHLEEEQVDEPAVEGEDRQNDKNSVEEEEGEEDMAMPVPQVKVGPDGQIILDEKSLVGFFYYWFTNGCKAKKTKRCTICYC